MFKIAHDKKITMVQGDTGVIRMKISNHELSQGDEVRFAIVNKANSSMLLCQHSDKKIVLEKQVTVFEKDGTARIVIYPYDTENLQPGKYLYEIQVKTKDGRIDTVVPLVSFTLMDGYIQGEYGQTTPSTPSTPSTPEPTPSEIEVRFKRLENEIIPELGTRVTNVKNEIDSINSSLEDLESEVNELKEGNIQIDLTNYATKDYVEDAINNAKLEGGDEQVDLSSYAKKTDLHEHSNKTILDSITTSKVNQWDNKSDFSGDYNDLTNKPTIPTKTSQLTNDTGYITEHQDISGKVDKVNGYSLVSDAEISRLATLKNYNDTEVRELINETNTSLEHIGSQMNEVFTSVSRGKTLIASAITDKGVTTSNTDTFETMANNISAISQGSPVYGDIVISTDAININEGGTGTFTVKLKEAPSVNQTVNLYRDNDDATIDKSSLIFTTSNWNIPQTVNCTVAHDEDYDNETCVITLTSRSVETKTLTINIIDDDKPIINVDTITLNKNIFTMSVNDTDVLRATITPIDATNKNITWNVSNDNCSITPNGLECTVTADKNGTCVVSATTEDGSKVATCTYTIEPTQENTLDIRYFKVERDENQLVMPTNLCGVDTANIGEHNDVVHPSILYFKNGWNGYKYWLAINPYPKTNSLYENPCMLVSNDGDNWETIGNVPIYPKMSGCQHNSDCHIFMNDDTMYYLNRGATSSSCKIEYFTSTDGVNWSERKLIIDEGEHNYLSPSVCKYNGKYYMFVYDHALTGTDDNDKRITVLESTTIDSEWVKVNTILCPNVPTIWHLEVKIIDGGFVGLIMSGNSAGGLLYLVKFDNPMDTIITEYVGSPIITPRGSVVEKSLYKSTFFENEKNEIEVYVNSKSSGTLDAFCHWTLNRSKMIKTEVEDFSSSEYTVSKEVDTSSFGTLGAPGLKGITLEYFDYQVKFKVGDITNNTIVLSAADKTDLIILKLTETSNAFYYLRSGKNINNIVITYEITSESIFRFIREDGANKLYINDRLVGIIDEKEHQDKHPYHYKLYFGGYSNEPYNISYCETSIKAINCIDLTKANEELQNEINNYSNEPNQYYLFDDFNRANGTLSVSVNGINYETDTTLPIIENNMCKVKSGGHKALFDLGTNNYTIFADLRPAFNIHSIYLRYVDSENYIAVVFGNYNLRKPSLIEVINGTINYYDYYVFNTSTIKYIVRCEVSNDYVILKVNNQIILNHSIVNKLETTKMGFGAMLANCNFDTIIVKK